MCSFLVYSVCTAYEVVPQGGRCDVVQAVSQGLLEQKNERLQRDRLCQIPRYYLRTIQ